MHRKEDAKPEIRSFIEAFFMLFEAHVEFLFELDEDRISGAVSWDGHLDDSNEWQYFLWVEIPDGSKLSKARMLCDFLRQHNLVNGDKIMLSPEALSSRLAGTITNREEAMQMIDALMSVEIRMVDDGEETDSFFIHF